MLTHFILDICKQVFKNLENRNEMPHRVAFHHCLLRYKQSSGTDIYRNLEI